MHSGSVLELFNLYNNFDQKKIIAIGETGFDSDRDFLLERKTFLEQIKLANYVHLPVIIHSKNANAEVIKILYECSPLHGFVFHCYQPDIEFLQEIHSLGESLSFASPITEKRKTKSRGNKTNAYR